MSHPLLYSEHLKFFYLIGNMILNNIINKSRNFEDKDEFSIYFFLVTNLTHIKKYNITFNKLIKNFKFSYLIKIEIYCTS